VASPAFSSDKQFSFIFLVAEVAVASACRPSSQMVVASDLLLAELLLLMLWLLRQRSGSDGENG